MFEDKDKTEKHKKKKYLIIIITIIILLLILFIIISNKIGKIGYTETSNEQIDIIDVTQNDLGWNLLEQLDIFNNSKFDNKKIIAPRKYAEFIIFL